MFKGSPILVPDADGREHHDDGLDWLCNNKPVMQTFLPKCPMQEGRRHDDGSHGFDKETIPGSTLLVNPFEICSCTARIARQC
jgi:hypothetical protein